MLWEEEEEIAPAPTPKLNGADMAHSWGWLAATKRSEKSIQKVLLAGGLGCLGMPCSAEIV